MNLRLCDACEHKIESNAMLFSVFMTIEKSSPVGGELHRRRPQKIDDDSYTYCELELDFCSQACLERHLENNPSLYKAAK